jgi:hypothetical protein
LGGMAVSCDNVYNFPDGKEKQSMKFRLRVLLASILLVLVAIGSSQARNGERDEVEFTDVRKHTKEFIGYFHSIKLTPEQEAVKREALSNLPAVCCSNNSAYTCCCVCNLSRTVWGLSHHLIAERGFDATAVRAAVVKWTSFVSPDGFSGDACFNGGCGRSFANNGCGGMRPNQVVW